MNFCNRGAIPVLVRLAISSTDTPSNSEYLMYDQVIDGNSVIQATSAELTEALILAGQAQAAIWIIT